MTLRSICFAWLLFLLSAQSGLAATFTVTNTADTGAGSLRQAITDANAAADADTIAFAIPAATDPGCVAATGVCTIVPASDLPDINTPMTIDGYTQTGATKNTNAVESRLGLNGALKIELRGTSVGSVLSIDSADVTVRGLVINDIGSYGIDIHLLSGNAVTIEGNYIGTDVGGTTALVHSASAIGIYAGSAGTILIGGTAPASRNLMSGGYDAVFTYNALAPTIQGNLIGTDVTGTQPLSASSAGLNLAPVAVAAVVGGTAAGAGNLIHNDSGYSLLISGGVGNQIQGNLIGTDVTGNNVIAHSSSVFLVNMTNALIGGTTTAARNVISGGSGLQVNTLSGATGTGNNRVQGNYFGTDISGTLDRGNSGLAILLGSAGTIVGGTDPGAGNVIAYTKSNGSAHSGIGILVGGATGQSILGNSIHANAAIGIDLAVGGVADGVTPNDAGDADTGANNLQNYPVLTSAAIAGGSATVSGTINSNASAALRLEFFASAVCSPSGNGEGQTFIGATSVTTDGSGNASFGPLSFVVPAGQSIITSTATSASGDTSEFSHCAIASTGTTPTATTTSLASSLNPSLFGQNVSFAANVLGTSPSGSVQFRDGAASLGGPVALVGASATLSTAALSIGTHSISAVYSGDAANASSTSPVVLQIVNAVVVPPPAPPSVSVAAPMLSVATMFGLLVVLAGLGMVRIANARRCRD